MTAELVIEWAEAYVYCGEWVADCPAGCHNVEFLFMSRRPGGPKIIQKPLFACSHCGKEAEIRWAVEMNGIMEVLMRRPNPDNRNWYPKDHPVAIQFRIAHGQSVSDLREENEAHGVSP